MVSDDIVTRLRVATVADSADSIYKSMTEAADEIERLRQELIQANNQIKLLIAIETSGKNPCSCDSSEGYICIYHE